jgi:acyl transferase domain-containing protein
MACRLAVIAATKEELVKRLREKQQEPKRSSAAKGESKDIIFVFPGQGSQYVGMAKEWYQSEPFFRQQVDRCLDIVSPMMRQDLRQIWFSDQLKGHLTGVASSGESAVRAINHTETAQPLLFIVEYAAAQLLMHWGIKPAAMIGHSLGEYTAACISGVLSLEDALRLIVRRSALMQKMEPGCMVHVHMTQENVKSLLSDWPDLSIAAANSTEMTVVSGPEASIGAFGDRLKTLGHDVVRLQVSHAFHSAMMEPMLAEYREALYGISLSAPAIPYVSNVSGTFITPEMAMDPEYYAGHVRQTVNFKDGIAALASRLDPLFIEVGPGQTLSQLIRANHHVTEEHPALHLLPGAREKRPAREILLQSLGGLWINGLVIDWSVCNAFKGSRSGKRIPLPTYPFEKEYYWSLWGGKEVDVRKEGGEDDWSRLADWFYIPQWTERHPVQTGSEDEIRNSANTRRVLVLANKDLLSERVADALQRQGESCVRVYPGSGFARISAAAFTVDPGSAADYAALYAALRQEHGDTPDTIMHLWGVDESGEGEAVRLAGEQAGALTGEQTLVKGLYSLIYLLQAGMAEPTQELKLLLAASGMERVNANEETHPLKSTLKGAASVIPLEYPNVSVCTLDLLPHEAAASIEMMLELLRSSGNQLDKVSTRYALRGSNCYQHSFAAADIAAGRPSGLKRHGVYLITGGLGGIGLALAGYLSERYQARLVLVSRTPRPVERQLEDMRATGAQVLVKYGDVSDEASLERMIAAAGAYFGPLDGVFHAAGVPAGGMIHSTAKEEIAAALRPKLDGTLALHGVLAALQPQPAFLVLFSSISGSFGAFGQVGYAAANAFLDGFAQSHVESGQGMSVLSIDWDTWNETGMAVDSLKRYNGRNRRTEELPQLHLRIKHPLLAACSDAAWDTPFIQQLEGSVQRTYISRLSAAEHWVLDEHRMLGTPVLPGTAYIELIRACFEDLTGERGVAIQELFFLQPLLVDEEVEIRSVWVDHGSHWEFAVVAEGPDGNWIEHAKGRAARDKITSEDRLTDAELEGIQSRLEEAEQAGDVLRTPIAAEDAAEVAAAAVEDADAEDAATAGVAVLGTAAVDVAAVDTASENAVAVNAASMNTAMVDATEEDNASPDAVVLDASAENAATLQYGPRWDSLQGMYSDNSQGVARLSLGDRYREDLTDYVLHPALLDRATSFMDGQEAERSSYLPFAYKNVVIREPMTAEIYSLVTRQGEERGETLAFSCRIADPLGHVLADIGEFVMKRVSASPAPARISVEAISAAPVVGSYKLDISLPGDIESLHFKPVARRKPGPGEVEIAVAANGLNFKEVLYALGILKLPDSHQFGFGLECAGTVSAVGQGVTDLKPGDEVMALAEASFGRYALALAGSVVRKPAGITFEEAATLPISYMTAYYALVKRGQLARGEKVLIHTATGGVGMAAIHIAKWIGAEIHATAGSMEKRDYLRSIGIEHVYPSRTLEFAEGIRKAVGSVDVVLNSLTGQAIEQGISLLAPHGRFLEMGVKDILENSQLGLSAFAQGASFTAINIGSHIPGYSDLFRDISGHVEAGHFAPLPFVSYPLEDTKQAFQYMAAAKHIGKIVIAHHPKTTLRGTGDSAAQLLNGMTNAEGLEVLERILSHACSAKAGVSVQYLISTTALEQRLSGLEAGSIAGTAVNSPATAPATAPASSRVRQRPTVSTEYSPPVTESEQQLSALVAEFLGLDKVGLHDNFFEIGATSLDMVQINTKVNALCGKDPSIVKMYSYPTVGLLNAYLFEDKQGSGDAAKETEQQKRKESRMKTLQSLKGGK